jgi:hypothetical protein
MSSHASHRPTRTPKPETAPPEGNTESVTTSGPQFAETSPTPDPSKFRVKHGSDKQAYSILDREAGTLEPRPFPVVKETEPVLKFADAIDGKDGDDVVDNNS